MGAFEQTLTSINPHQPVGIDCIDDRGYAGSRQNIKLGGAASYGQAHDTYATRALNGIGDLEYERPLGEAAKVIAQGLARHALLARLHRGCAAENVVLAVADQIVTDGETIFRDVNRILDGQADESKFERLQAFHAQIRRGAAVFRGMEIEAACMASDQGHPAIPRSHLAHTDHAAKELAINTQPDTWHDAAQAYAAGDPRYGYDLWAVRPIAERIDTIIPHDSVDDFVLASVARVVATSRLLPRTPDQTGVDIAIY